MTSTDQERAFWREIRRALIIVTKAIECRYIEPHQHPNLTGAAKESVITNQNN